MAKEHEVGAHRAIGEIAAELRRREPIFHTPEFGKARSDLEAMIADDFWEVGASGRCYSRAHVIDAVVDRGAVPGEELWEVNDFCCRQLGSHIYAVTYELRQQERVTRRLTLWRETESGWQILYHQGTVVSVA